MARYPRAAWRPLPENATEGANRPRLFIVHIIVGSLAGADAWFRREDVKTESHFGLGKGHESDPVRQWIDTRREADTNWDANGISITVETAGMPDEPFTDFQIAELVAMGQWAAKTHDIPLQIAGGPAGAGFGWHSQYGEWNRSHHTCPGATRIRQLREVVFPAIFDMEDPMPRFPDAWKWCRNAGIYSKHTVPGDNVDTDTLSAFLHRHRRWVNRRVAAAAGGGATTGAVIAEIVSRLS